MSDAPDMLDMLESMGLLEGNPDCYCDTCRRKRGEDIPELDTKALLREFIEKFDASKDPKLWSKLITEEVREAEEALAHLLEETADISYVISGLMVVADTDNTDQFFEPGIRERLFRILQLTESLNFFGLGAEAFRRKHAANLSKLGEDGKPIKREDGKVLKGPNYKPADLMDLITGEVLRRKEHDLSTLKVEGSA